MIGIYKITSPTGRIYIGQSRNIGKRKNSYKNNRCLKQPRLRSSIEKHGWDSHIFEVVEECDFYQLNNRERYWQEYYDVLDQHKGMNCLLTPTDIKPAFISEETRKVMSESNVKCMTQEVRDKIRNTMTGKKVPQERRDRISMAMKGVKKSDETRARMSRSQKGRIPSREAVEKTRQANLGRKRNLSNKEREKRRMECIERMHTPEVREKIRLSKIGTTIPADVRKKISDTLKSKEDMEYYQSVLILDTYTGVYYYSYKDLCLLHKMSVKHLSDKLRGKKINNTRYVIA